ncbi:MAG: hypothetical protein V1721_05475 [Pseudomonadota bacterium]
MAAPAHAPGKKITLNKEALERIDAASGALGFVSREAALTSAIELLEILAWAQRGGKKIGIGKIEGASFMLVEKTIKLPKGPSAANYFNNAAGAGNQIMLSNKNLVKLDAASGVLKLVSRDTALAFALDLLDTLAQAKNNGKEMGIGKIDGLDYMRAIETVGTDKKNPGHLGVVVNKPRF